MEDIEIFLADRTMLSRICEIEKESFSVPWSESSIDYCLSHYPNRVTAAFRNGVLVGFAIAMFIEPECEIADIAVTPSEGRGGVGRALMNEILAHGSDVGCTDYYLEVRESNEAARRLYSSLGFCEYSRVRRYYREPTEDAILMRLGINERLEQRLGEN